MSTPAHTPPSPRRRPSQGRSRLTVEALFEATLQVLEREEYARLTTTRIAERAGVSVGSVYQYFPDKRSLLAELLRSHIRSAVDTIEASLQATAGASLEVQVGALVEAYLGFKRSRVRTSRALQPVFADLSIAALAAPELMRARAVTARALLPYCEAIGADPQLAATILVGSLEGPVTALVTQEPERLAEPALAQHLTTLALGYLKGLAALAPPRSELP